MLTYIPTNVPLLVIDLGRIVEFSPVVVYTQVDTMSPLTMSATCGY